MSKEDEELLKKFYFEFLKQEREEEGPFEYDEEEGEDMIVWQNDDFDEDGENLRDGMKQWQWLYDGEDGPDEDTVLARDEDRHWVLAPKKECVRVKGEWVYEEKSD